MSPSAGRLGRVRIPFTLRRSMRRLRARDLLGGVKHLPSVGSTNTLATEAAQAGAREGVWVADEQTAGRGRGGHGWHSAAGDGLYVSALVVSTGAPGKGGPDLAGYGAGRARGDRGGDRTAGGYSVAERSAAPRPQVRRDPGRERDGFADGAEGGGAMRYAVIGVGLNVEHRSFPEELREVATSLANGGWARCGSREAIDGAAAEPRPRVGQPRCGAGAGDACAAGEVCSGLDMGARQAGEGGMRGTAILA